MLLSGHKALAVALFSRWEEGDKASSRHAWLILQVSVARTERAKKTTWWPKTAATADLRPDAKHILGGWGWGNAATGGKADFHRIPQNTLSPTGSCSSADPCPRKTPRAAVRHPRRSSPRKPCLYCAGSPQLVKRTRLEWHGRHKSRRTAVRK